MTTRLPVVVTTNVFFSRPVGQVFHRLDVQHKWGLFNTALGFFVVLHHQASPQICSVGFSLSRDNRAIAFRSTLHGHDFF
jgi:hypothetical protein